MPDVAGFVATAELGPVIVLAVAVTIVIVIAIVVGSGWFPRRAKSESMGPPDL